MKKPLQTYSTICLLAISIFLVCCHREKRIKISANCPCHDFSIGEGVNSILKDAPGFELDTTYSNEKSQYILSDDCDIDSIPVGEEITATTRYDRVVTITADLKSERPLSSLLGLLKAKFKDRFKLAKSSVGNYYTTYDYVDSTYYFFYKIPRVDTANYVIKYEIGFRDEVINKISDPEK